MQGRPAREGPRALRRQRDADAAAVLGVGMARHEPGALAAVDQADRALVPDLQRFGELRDDRGTVAEAADEEEQLILAGGDPGLPRGVLREAQEPAQGVPKAGEPLIVEFLESVERATVESYRNTIEREVEIYRTAMEFLGTKRRGETNEQKASDGCRHVSNRSPDPGGSRPGSGGLREETTDHGGGSATGRVAGAGDGRGSAADPPRRSTTPRRTSCPRTWRLSTRRATCRTPSSTTTRPPCATTPGETSRRTPPGSRSSRPSASCSRGTATTGAPRPTTWPSASAGPQSAREYLISMGVPEDRIRTVSYGKERPFCQTNDESCWQDNRRDHFVVTAK